MREPIITASEWDPSPGESEEESLAAGDGQRLCSILLGDHEAVNLKQLDVEPNFRTPASRLTGTTFEQFEGKSLFLWPPEPGTRLAFRNSEARSMVLMNARLERQYQLTLGSAAPAVEASHISATIGTGMRQATEHQATAQDIQDHGCKAGDGNKAFWHSRFGKWRGFLGKMGCSLGGVIEGRQIWDPGGKEAKLLLAVGEGG